MLYFTRYYPLKSQKHEKLLFWWIIWGPGNQCEIQWFFMILWISESFSLYLLVKNSFNFKLGFFTYFEYISGGIIRKNILHSDYHSARWYWCKKTRKTFHKLHINVFLFVVEFLKLWSLHCYEHLWFKNPPELQVFMI